MLQVWLKADHQPWFMVGHPEHVVAVIAADIRYYFTLKIRKFRKNPAPFPFTALFGINLNTENFKRPLTPRHEITHGLIYLFAIPAWKLIRTADFHHIT